jgi:hypothetical protein
VIFRQLAGSILEQRVQCSVLRWTKEGLMVAVPKDGCLPVGENHSKIR